MLSRLYFTGNTINWAFAKSLQRFDNKYPIGYIYDDRGWGIWFIGWWQWNSSWHNNLIAKLDQLSWINTLFWYDGSNNSSIKRNWISISTTAWNAINTMMNAWIQGTIWLSFSMNTVEKNTILGNFDKKTLMFNALNVNFSKLINTVRKNTENLCKWKYEDWAYIDFGNDTRKLFCIEYPVANANNFIRIDDYNRQDLKNKTIIVKNWDVRIWWSMPVDGWPVNIFIDKWNLLIANNSTSAVNFDWNGYATNNVWVSKWTYLKWNFIINGLIIWADVVANTWTKWNFENKLFLNWKFASLNTPNYPSQWRINQITTLFESNVNNNRIRLGKVFTWECNPITGIGSDWSTSCSNSLDKTASLPLIIIDGYYPSNLIQ